MPSVNTGLWILALLALSTAAGAATVQRCVGNDGQLTFTHTSCPDGSAGQRERVWNMPPGSLAPVVQGTVSEAPKARPRRTEGAADAPKQMPATKEKPEAGKKKPEVEKKGTKKKKAKYTPWRPARS